MYFRPFLSFKKQQSVVFLIFQIFWIGKHVLSALEYDEHEDYKSDSEFEGVLETNDFHSDCMHKPRFEDEIKQFWLAKWIGMNENH